MLVTSPSKRLTNALGASSTSPSPPPVFTKLLVCSTTLQLRTSSFTLPLLPVVLSSMSSTMFCFKNSSFSLFTSIFFKISLYPCGIDGQRLQRQHCAISSIWPQVERRQRARRPADEAALGAVRCQPLHRLSGEPARGPFHPQDRR